MNHPAIQATLAARGGSRVALTFTNATDHDAYLYRPNACEGGAVENNVFLVRSAQGTEARYTGLYVKRREPTREDFVTLPARQARTVEIDLATAYELPKGSTWSVTYEAFHNNPAKADDLWLVRSGAVTIG
jgi:hypothetical protein